MGGHDPPLKIPSYTSFKVEGIAELEALEKALARKGLKDPWIRNEAWRYHPGFGTKWSRARNIFFRGLPIGLALTIITVGLEKTLGGGGHGHEHSSHGEH